MKKTFTLVEILATLVVIGILTAIVIPKIGDMRKDANRRHIESNIATLQTAVDRYALKNDEALPTVKEPTVQHPELILVDELYPTYIKNKIDYEKVKDQRYWVDAFGKVWGSTKDAPSRMERSEDFVQWERDPEVMGYQVYELTQDKVSGKAFFEKVKFVSSVKMEAKTNRIELKTGEKDYLFSSIDEYGMESAPVGPEYLGFQDGFTPIKGKKGEFEFEFRSRDKMLLRGYTAWEHKPEGSSISYEFATKDGEFSPTFPKGEKSEILKVKVKMTATKRLPSIYNFVVHFAYAGEDWVTGEKVTNPSTVPDICKEKECSFYTPKDPVNVDNFVVSPGRTEPSVGSDGSATSESFTDGYAPFTPIVKYYCQTTGAFHDSLSEYKKGCADEKPVVMCTDCGSMDFVSKDESLFVNPEPIPENNPQEKVVELVKGESNEKPSGGSDLFLPLQDKEWETIQTLTFFAQSPDGTKIRWLSADITDKQPENTRIVYSFRGNNPGDKEQEDITKTGQTRGLQIRVYLQVKTTHVDKVEGPQFLGMVLTHEKGVTNLSLVKPTVALYLDKDNNGDRDMVSVSSKVTFRHEASDPRGLDIVETEWSGPKQTSYPTAGTYKVGVRVKNSSLYWSDWTYLTFEVKPEKPVASFEVRPRFIEANRTIEWIMTASNDPDGDAIVKYDWDGNKKDRYTDSDVGNHLIRLRVQDAEGNWSDWVEKTITVYEEGAIVFKGLDDKAFDRDTSTKVDLFGSTLNYVTWDGPLSSKVVRIYSKSINEASEIRFYDSSDKQIPYIHHGDDKMYTSLSVNGYRDVVVPQEAVKMGIWNRYYPSVLEDIHVVGENWNPTGPKDLLYSPGDYDVTFKWTTDPTKVKEVAFYAADNTFLGKSSTGELKVGPLFSDTEYVVRATSVSPKGNRSPFDTYQVKTSKPALTWKGLSPEAFDGDPTTSYIVGPNKYHEVTWDGALDGKLIELKAKVPSEVTWVQFYDASNKLLPIIDGATNETTTRHDLKTTSTLVVPDGAVKMTLLNRYYNSTLYDIRLIGDETRPRKLGGVSVESGDYNLRFSWTNPNDSDVQSVSLYTEDHRHVGTTTGTSLTSTALTPATQHLHYLVVTDKSGNRSERLYVTGTTTKPTIELKGLTPAAFDGDPNTKESLWGSRTYTLTFEGPLEGRHLLLTGKKVSENTMISFVDETNKTLPFLNVKTGTTVSSLGIFPEAEVKVPEGTVQIRLYNRYYSQTLYDIVVK